MENISTKKIKILKQIEDIKKAINDEVDWYIAYLGERDTTKKKLHYFLYENKKEKRISLANKITDEK